MAEVETGTQDLAGAASEEAADFARLEMMAGGGVEPGAEAVLEPEAPKMDAAESMAGLLTMAASVAGMAGFGRTAALWSPEVCTEASAKVVPVLRKYPWGTRVLDFFETGAGVEEIALGAFMLPMGLATWQAIKADMRPHDAQEAPAKVTPGSTLPEVGGMVEVTGRAD